MFEKMHKRQNQVNQKNFSLYYSCSKSSRYFIFLTYWLFKLARLVMGVRGITVVLIHTLALLPERSVTIRVTYTSILAKAPSIKLTCATTGRGIKQWCTDKYLIRKRTTVVVKNLPTPFTRPTVSLVTTDLGTIATSLCLTNSTPMLSVN